MVPTRYAAGWPGPVALGLLVLLPAISVPIASVLDALPRGEVRKVASGVFLVASPQLTEPNFNETVVLIVEHGPGGTTGVVINRPTTTPLSRVLPAIKELAGRSDTLFVGGPVARQVLTVLVYAEVPPPSSTPVFDNVYASRRVETLTHVLKGADPGARFRLYSGYAGWAPGQLQHEIDLGGWRLMKADSTVVFNLETDSIWPALIRRLSEQFVRTERPAESSISPFGKRTRSR